MRPASRLRDQIATLLHLHDGLTAAELVALTGVRQRAVSSALASMVQQRRVVAAGKRLSRSGAMDYFRRVTVWHVFDRSASASATRVTAPRRRSVVSAGVRTPAPYHRGSVWFGVRGADF